MEAEKLLTIGVFAHANAGKTTITENLLYNTNEIAQIGRVDTGNTVTDSMEIEQRRGITVRASLVSFKTNGKKVQLIDTPGHVDFSAEVERSISVLDGAILVVSGVESIEAQTYTIWRALKQKNIPTIIFINKMDRANADYEKVLQDIQRKLKANIIPFCKIRRNENAELIYTDATIDELFEYLANVPDEETESLVSEYLNNNSKYSILDVYEHIYNLAQKASIIPVIGGSGLKSIGIDNLIDCIGKCLPEATRDLEDPFSAFVYTVRVNDSNQKNLYVRVLSGKVSVRDTIDLGDDERQKITSLACPNGTKPENRQEILAGEIGIITGVDAKCGDIIGDQKRKNDYYQFVKPLLNMEVNTVKKEQVLNLVDALKILNDEDPYLNPRYDKQTGKIYISLMGEVQSQIISEMLSERFNLETMLSNPQIIHKETPTKEGKGEASYTRVSGVTFTIKPLPRGSGLVYESKLSTDFLHKKYQRQAERLVKQYISQGLYGWEVTDAEINLVDGRFDSMGSEPKHFNIAVPLALMRALKQADMKVLEPISHYTIITPSKDLRNVLQTLTSKGGISEIISDDDVTSVIEGEIPMEAVLDFPVKLNKITSGLGSYASRVEKYQLARNQEANRSYVGADPRNEVTFVINDMNANLDSLDPIRSKKKKVSRSKFKRNQRENEIRIEKKEAAKGVKKNNIDRD